MSLATNLSDKLSHWDEGGPKKQVLRCLEKKAGVLASAVLPEFIVAIPAKK
jgi:hypothetical protein